MNLSLIAPYAEALPMIASRLTTGEYEQTIADIQRFRNRIYVQNGAIPSYALDKSGRHNNRLDYAASHIIARNNEGTIVGIMRMPTYVNGAAVWFLQLYHVLERMDAGPKALYSHKIQQFIDQHATNYPFVVEPGGWAIDRQLCNRETGTLLMAAAWAYCQAIGGAVAISAVTVKNKAADFLKMMGGLNCMQGTSREWFYDPLHQCELQIIVFHSDRTNARFANLVDEVKNHWQKQNALVA